MDTRRFSGGNRQLILEAQRLSREVEAKKRKLQEAIEKESSKDARMGDDPMDGLDGSLLS